MSGIIRGRDATRVVHATAPIRVCDNGGWTDTWVARHGYVFNIAVQPLVHVRIDAFPAGTRDARIVIDAVDFVTRYAVDLDNDAWGRHPLLEAAIRRVRPPDEADIEIAIHSSAPAGAATGTSAAVSVALLGALHRLRGSTRTPAEIASDAHAIEVDDLGQQSGIQDQLASAFGGVNFIEIVEYPRAVVTPLTLDAAVLADLDRRLSLLYFGRPHHSSSVHTKVMAGLERLGPDCAPLESLRAAAVKARDAALAGDLDALGRAMCDNTAAQADLHRDLVSPEAWRIIEIAEAHGAAGWKVNGAGGDGGSMVVLGPPDTAARQAMLDAMLLSNRAMSHIPIAISRDGLRVWDG